MNEYPCLKCGRDNTWSTDYCRACDSEKIYNPKYAARERSLKRRSKLETMLDAYASPYLKDKARIVDHLYEMEYSPLQYEDDYWAQKRYVDPLEEERLQKEAEKAKAHWEAENKLIKREALAEYKDCSDCEKYMPHDKNDYICIVCREGETALSATFRPRPCPVNPTI